jgi:hypothetical protein
MDPNAALDKALAAARSVLTTYDAVTGPHILDDPDFVVHAAALAEAMTDLDEWFRRGGFRPRPLTTGGIRLRPQARRRTDPRALTRPLHEAEPGRPPPGMPERIFEP